MRLEIHQFPDILDDSIVYGIRKCLSFEAISYVWGQPLFTHPIYLTAGMLHLTSNLAAVLMAVRLPDCHRYVWADAICINQTDVVEKAHQVKRMGGIYNHAQRVLIWLGINTDGLASETFQAIVNTSKLPQDVEAERAALLRLATREWFTRVWVVQESRGSSPLMIWGIHQMELREFENRLQHLFTHRIRLDHRWLLFPSSFVDVFHFMSWLRPMSCSDQRDRVYALQGLIYQSACSLSHEIRLLEPDYHKSAEQLFLETACIFLSHGKAARVLSCVNRPHGTTAVNRILPS